MARRLAAEALPFSFFRVSALPLWVALPLVSARALPLRAGAAQAAAVMRLRPAEEAVVQAARPLPRAAAPLRPEVAAERLRRAAA